MKAMLISFEALLGAELGMLMFGAFIAATCLQISHAARVSSDQGMLMSEYELSQQIVSSVYGLNLNYSSSSALASGLSGAAGLNVSIMPMSGYSACIPGSLCRIVEIGNATYIMVIT